MVNYSELIPYAEKYILISIYIIVLYYLDAIHNKHCTCKLDYRYHMVKVLSIMSFAMAVIWLLDSHLIDIINQYDNVYKGFNILFKVFNILLLITLFAYIIVLNKKKCNCAQHDVRGVNKFLSVIKYFGLFYAIYLIYTFIH